MNGSDILIRPAEAADQAVLQEIRQAAFEPVFASFRSILGDEIYARAQPDDDAQAGLLASLLKAGSGWEVYAAEYARVLAGFVSVRLDRERRVGEIGLNAVRPEDQGKGIGTKMYEFAIERMREAGMRVATVATGADASHAPARRAYEKAGFDRGIPSVWYCREL